MKSLNEILTNNPVEMSSQKVANLNSFPSSKSGLKLPSHDYGPFCMRILHEFMEHHKIPEMPLPHSGISTHEALSRIFDIMLCSMGEEKRSEILKNLNEYNMGIPAHFRQ